MILKGLLAIRINTWTNVVISKPSEGRDKKNHCIIPKMAQEGIKVSN